MLLESLLHVAGVGGGDGSGNEPAPVPVWDASASGSIYEPFKLPLAYQPESRCRPLSATLVQDLELCGTEGGGGGGASDSMYTRLFQPSHSFGRQLIPEWGKHFSSDVAYLKDTQAVLTDMPGYQSWMTSPGENFLSKGAHAPAEPFMTQDRCDRILTLWSGVHRPDFLEKYSYMEWSFLTFLNESSSFLQILSVGNMMSPLISLFIPVLFLLMPFVVLSIQGVCISWDTYLTTLKNVARNHFIGKAMVGLQSLSWDKLLYVLLMLGLYLMQVYQNVMACVHFYQNTQQVNQDLVDLDQFCVYSARSMDTFVKMHGDRPTYRAFCQEAARRSQCLKGLHERLRALSPFGLRMQKVGELGAMMSCYYHVHSCAEVQEAVRYAIGFEGYINNLRGVSHHLNAGNVAFAQFSSASAAAGGGTKFLNQYYPALLDGGQERGIVKNDVSLKKNMIITGPNASGKTTFLKTTAINVIFTQQLGCGYYGAGSRLPRPYTHIHSYLNIPDTSERDSLFQAEARRCKEILDTVDQAQNAVHFSIFDELYSGTNPREATKAAYAFLKYLSQRPNVDFILTTHYTEVCRQVKKTCKRRIHNYKMEVARASVGGAAAPPSMKYTYRIKRGISTVEGAGKILEDMNYPSEIMHDFIVGNAASESPPHGPSAPTAIVAVEGAGGAVFIS